MEGSVNPVTLRLHNAPDKSTKCILYNDMAEHAQV